MARTQHAFPNSRYQGQIKAWSDLVDDLTNLKSAIDGLVTDVTAHDGAITDIRTQFIALLVKLDAEGIPGMDQDYESSLTPDPLTAAAQTATGALNTSK